MSQTTPSEQPAQIGHTGVSTEVYFIFRRQPDTLLAVGTERFFSFTD